MGKRGELEDTAIHLYAEGAEIPKISSELGVSENSLRAWKQRAGQEWDEARAACRKGRVASFEDVGARLHRSRQLGEIYGGDSKSQSKVGLSLNQALQTVVWDLLGKMQTSGEFTPEDFAASIDQVKGLTLSLARLEQSANLNLKREQEIRKQALLDAANNVEKAAVQKGMNSEEAAFWRQLVLGVQ